MAMYKKYRLNISWESQFSRFSNGRRSWRSNWSDKCNAPSEALVIIIIIITKNKVAGLNWGGGWLKSSYPFKNKINAYRSKWERGLLKKKGKAKKKKKAAFLSSVKSRKSTSRLSLTLLFSNRHPEEQHTQKEPAPLPLRKNIHRNSPQTFCGNLSPRDRYWRLKREREKKA